MAYRSAFVALMILVTLTARAGVFIAAKSAEEEGFGTCSNPASTIFTEDFETFPNGVNYDCNTDGIPSPWNTSYSQCEDDYPSTGQGGELRGCAGRNGGVGLCAYKHATYTPNGYRSQINYFPTAGEQKSEIYYRWFMKVPTAANWDKAIPSNYKWWRFRVDPNVGGFIYFQVRGSQWSTGTNAISYNRTGAVCWFTDTADFQDNEWHMHEIRINLNTGSNPDGDLEYWFDGVAAGSCNDVVVSANNQGYVDRWGIGIGNVSDPAWEHTGWSAVAYDDLVVAEEYIGCQ